MPLINCPRCQQRILTQVYDTDVIHDCNSGNKTLDEEDVRVIGTYEDDVHAGNLPSGAQATVEQASSFLYSAGITKTNAGRRSSLEGDDVYERSRRGARKATTIVRSHQEYIRLSKGDN